MDIVAAVFRFTESRQGENRQRVLQRSGSGFQVCSGNAVMHVSEVKTSIEVVPRYIIVLHDIFVMEDF